MNCNFKGLNTLKEKKEINQNKLVKYLNMQQEYMNSYMGKMVDIQWIFQLLLVKSTDKHHSLDSVDDFRSG